MKKAGLNRSILAWAMYDFGNSAFATSVLAVIFNVYFASVLVPKEGLHFLGMTIPGESLWGYLISSVMAVVILLSPSLGALADERGLKRRLLMFWAILGAVSTMGLLWATRDNLPFAALCAFVATLGFEMSLVFYNAFLNDISDDETAGRVSGLGFALGYIGGGLCLAINMMMLKNPSAFGLDAEDPTWPVRAGMFLVGLWWLLFSLPIFLWVRDRPVLYTEPRPRGTIFVESFRQLKKTLESILRIPQVGRFLLAFIIYDDGIQTILLMASIFGAKALGMSTAQLALCFLMIQFVAFVGALICGRLADAWSHKKVVLITLVLYSLVVIWGVLMKSQREFWVLGVVVGLIMGGSQAATRSFFSIMIPSAQAGEFFALYSIVGKAGALIGPFVFGVVSQFVGLRWGVGSLLIFFVVGGGILFSVDEKKAAKTPSHL